MTQPTDAAMNAPTPAPDHPAQTTALLDASILDVDLLNRIDAVGAEQRSNEERFQPSRKVLLESAAWLVVGIAMWAVTILVWR